MDAERVHQKVVVIRLPANYQGTTNLPVVTANQGNGPTITDINQIPDDVIAQMVSDHFPSETANTSECMNTNSTTMIDSAATKPLDMYQMNHLGTEPKSSALPITANHNTYSKNSIASNSADPSNGGHASNGDGSNNKEEETVQYKNYSPKQREWMLVVLSYSRGLLAKPFEMKLQDVVIEKAREVLKKNAPTFKMTDRIPTPKTLRSVWKNLWKHPERTVGVVKKGGRPRIDPAIKRQKRNEREKRRRAALRQSKQQAAQASSEYYQMEQEPTTPRRSLRGQQ